MSLIDASKIITEYINYLLDELHMKIWLILNPAVIQRLRRKYHATQSENNISFKSQMAILLLFFK